MNSLPMCMNPIPDQTGSDRINPYGFASAPVTRILVELRRCYRNSHKIQSDPVVGMNLLGAQNSPRK
jgi:hypothetical protein